MSQQESHPTSEAGPRPEGETDPPAGTNKYAHLPEPIRPEQMVTTSEASTPPEEKDDYWREVEWMLRVSGGA